MSNLYEPILACPPTDPKLLALSGVKSVEPMPGSKTVHCEKCGTECLLGPNLAAVKERHPKAPMLCYVCAAIEADGAPVTPMGPTSHTFTPLKNEEN